MSLSAAEVVAAASAGKSDIFEKITALTGSVPDLIAAVDVVRGWVQAQDGLAYESHTFAVTGPPKKEATPSGRSASTSRGARGSTGGRSADQFHSRDPIGVDGPTGPDFDLPATTAERRGALVQSAASYSGLLPQVLTLETTGTGSTNTARFGIAYRRTSPISFACTTFLESQRGFDTAIGSQAACAFGGEGFDVPEAGNWHALTFSGWVNKIGPGFIRFGGLTLVGVDKTGVLLLLPALCKYTTTSGNDFDVDWSRPGYRVKN
jgi:hypothetical protein